jgi:hypothetical protein
MTIKIVPRCFIRLISAEYIIQTNYNILISNMLILIGILTVRLNYIDCIPHFCIFEKLTNLPCPGCGITRSFVCIRDFRFVDSIEYNPCGLLIVGLLIFQIPMSIIVINYKKLSFHINKISTITDKIVILSLLLVWIFKINHTINF